MQLHRVDFVTCDDTVSSNLQRHSGSHQIRSSGYCSIRRLHVAYVEERRHEVSFFVSDLLVDQAVRRDFNLAALLRINQHIVRLQHGSAIRAVNTDDASKRLALVANSAISNATFYAHRSNNWLAGICQPCSRIQVNKILSQIQRPVADAFNTCQVPQVAASLALNLLGWRFSCQTFFDHVDHGSSKGLANSLVVASYFHHRLLQL